MSFRAFDLLKLVEDFGEPLTLKKSVGASSYNPATGSIGGVTHQLLQESAASILLQSGGKIKLQSAPDEQENEHNFTGYFYDYSLSSPEEVVRGSRKCVIPYLNSSIDPFPDDLIVGNGDTVKVTKAVSIFSNGVAVCYICDVQE